MHNYCHFCQLCLVTSTKKWEMYHLKWSAFVSVDKTLSNLQFLLLCEPFQSFIRLLVRATNDGQPCHSCQLPLTCLPMTRTDTLAPSTHAHRGSSFHPVFPTFSPQPKRQQTDKMATLKRSDILRKHSSRGRPPKPEKERQLKQRAAYQWRDARRIYLAGSFERWRKLRSRLQLKDSSLAWHLLETHDKGCYNCRYTFRHYTVLSLLCTVDMRFESTAHL